MKDFVKRIMEEQAELQGRLEKLDDFLNGSVFKTLTDKEQGLLIDQYKAMSEYNHILVVRMKYYLKH